MNYTPIESTSKREQQTPPLQERIGKMQGKAVSLFPKNIASKMARLSKVINNLNNTTVLAIKNQEIITKPNQQTTFFGRTIFHKDDPKAVHTLLREMLSLINEVNQLGSEQQQIEGARQLLDCLESLKEHSNFQKTESQILNLFNQIQQDCHDTIQRIPDEKISDIFTDINQMLTCNFKIKIEPMILIIEKKISDLENLEWFKKELSENTDLQKKLALAKEYCSSSKISLPTAEKVYNAVNATKWINLSQKVTRYYMESYAKLQQPLTSEGSPIKDTLSVEKIKTYFEPTVGTLVIDIGTQQLGEGSFKIAKNVLRVLPNGDLSQIVRYISSDKTDMPKFIKDINLELSRREDYKLSDIPNLLKLHKLQYINKNGQLKTRYFAEKCDGTLFDLIEQGINSQQERVKAISICLGSLKGLIELHEHGLIHADLKPENLFHKDGKAKLADLGLSVGNGEEKPALGTPPYIAPELLENTFNQGADTKFSPAIDAFSFGMTLLSLFDEGALNDFAYDFKEVLAGNLSLTDFLQEMEHYRTVYLPQFVSSQESLKKLIISLLDPNPTTRMTPVDAYPILQQILEEEKKKI